MRKTTEVLYRIYSFLQYALAAYLLWYGWNGFVAAGNDYPVLLALFLFALILGQKLVPLNPGRTLWISLADPVFFMVLFAFPLSVTVWFTAITYFCLYASYIFLGTFRTKNLVFSATTLFVISFGTGSVVFHWLTGGTLEQAVFGSSPLALPAVFLVWVVVLGINVLNLAVTLGPSGKLDLFTFLRSVPQSVQYEDLISTLLGALLAILFRRSPFAAFLVGVPVVIFALSNEAYARTATEFSKLMEVLLKALESSDPSGYSHSQRVALYAKELASKMGIKGGEAREIYELGLIHDLGTVAIPDSVIFKQGPLTPSEWELVRAHSLQTGEFVKGFGRFKKGLLSLESHHERVDGLGYPRKLMKDEIPIAARVIAVADAYDAMTNDRPYRKRLTKEVALRRIWMGKETQFDAAVVKALFAYLEEEEPAEGEWETALWLVAGALGYEMDLPAGRLDDLRESVILHELNPPADIFSKPGEASSFWWQVDYREHVGITDGLRRDVPTGDEAIKILWSHHEWYSESKGGAPILPEAKILAVSEAFLSCLAGGMDWPLAVVRIKERVGEQFEPEVVRALENALAKGKIPIQLLVGGQEAMEPPAETRRPETGL